MISRKKHKEQLATLDLPNLLAHAVIQGWHIRAGFSTPEWFATLVDTKGTAEGPHQPAPVKWWAIVCFTANDGTYDYEGHSCNIQYYTTRGKRGPRKDNDESSLLGAVRIAMVRAAGQAVRK